MSTRFCIIVIKSLLLGLLFSIVGLVLYPIFVPDTRPIGIVVDVNRQPIPNAVLRFRDAQGKLVKTIRADKTGQFCQHKLGNLTRYSIDGFMVSRYLHSTGGRSRFIFSPTYTHVAVFRDEFHRPMTDFAISILPDPRTYSTNKTRHQIEIATDKTGTVLIDSAPAVARYQFRSENSRFVITNVGTHTTG